MGEDILEQKKRELATTEKALADAREAKKRREDKESLIKRLVEFDDVTRRYLNALDQMDEALTKGPNIEDIKKISGQMNTLSLKFENFSDLSEAYRAARGTINKKISALKIKIQEKRKEGGAKLLIDIEIPGVSETEESEKLNDTQPIQPDIGSDTIPVKTESKNKAPQPTMTEEEFWEKTGLKITPTPGTTPVAMTEDKKMETPPLKTKTPKINLLNDRLKEKEPTLLDKTKNAIKNAGTSTKNFTGKVIDNTKDRFKSLKNKKVETPQTSTPKINLSRETREKTRGELGVEKYLKTFENPVIPIKKEKIPEKKFDTKKTAEEINAKIAEEEAAKGAPLSPEEKRQRVWELFLEAKEKSNAETIDSAGWLKSPLKKFDKWWSKDLEKTKRGKLGKVAMSAAFIGSTTLLTGAYMGIAPTSAGVIVARLSSRVAMATGLNMALTSNLPGKFFGTFKKEDKGEHSAQNTTEEKAWKKFITSKNGVMALSIGASVGAAFILSGGMAVAVVGTGSMVARRALNAYFDKKIEAKKKEVEKMKGEFDINALTENLEKFGTEYEKITKNLGRLSWGKGALNGALTMGAGLATMEALSHNTMSGHGKLPEEYTEPSPYEKELENNIKREGFSGSIYYDSNRDVMISKGAYWDTVITRDGHMQIINESKEMPEGISPLKEREMSDDEIKFYKKIGFKITSPNTTPIPSPSGPAEVPPQAFQNEGIKFEHGKGGIQAILDLKKQIETQYGGDYSRAPQSVRDFMNTDATKEAMKLGLFKPGQDAESALVGEGSVLKFDEHGNLSLHDTITNKDSVLVHGENSTVEEYAGKMLDSDKSGETPTLETDTSESFHFANERPSELGKFGNVDLVGEHLEPNYQENAEVIAARERVLAGMEERGQQHFGDALHKNVATASETIPTAGGTSLLQEYRDIIKNHPEFAKYSKDFTPVKLVEFYETHKGNTNFIFKDDASDSWEKLKDLRAISVLDQTGSDDSATRHLAEYVRLIRRYTGLSPRSNWFVFGRGKTAEEYIVDGLKILKEEGRLEQFEAALKK